MVGMATLEAYHVSLQKTKQFKLAGRSDQFRSGWLFLRQSVELTKVFFKKQGNCFTGCALLEDVMATSR